MYTRFLIRANGRSTWVAENRGTHWPDVYLFASTQKPGITVSASIFEDKCLLGVAWVIDIDLAALSKFLQCIVLKMGNDLQYLSGASWRLTFPSGFACRAALRE